ncbi:MAG: sugar phosphate isomerase/epimerase [Armatimonadetes bacterium]|nr:sugar phosphate isomerase/epimerase [Armatimonadota bacterium]MDW8121544.1 sugar phosphate isomerase/epimerase [Armatimonadota bacterium]
MTEQQWLIGCFNRPWSPWSYDVALDGMRQAGFSVTGLVGSHQGEPFLSDDATAEYLENLSRRIAAAQLKPIVAWLDTRHDIPLSQALEEACRKVDKAALLGLQYLMSGGVHHQDQYDHYYQLMRLLSEYAARRSIQIVVKPHGGCCASADELLTCLEKVDHFNFRIWYDAGNIIHYTGKDPVKDVERVARWVTGFCAKDCATLGGPVMIQFGEGKVDFEGVFRCLLSEGFSGPIMVECCAGDSPEQVTKNARQNRLFLEKILPRASAQVYHRRDEG